MVKNNPFYSGITKNILENYPNIKNGLDEGYKSYQKDILDLQKRAKNVICKLKKRTKELEK